MTKDIIEIDYAKLECQMLKDLKESIDIHIKKASEIFGVPLAQITPKMRKVNKQANYISM